VKTAWNRLRSQPLALAAGLGVLVALQVAMRLAFDKPWGQESLLPWLVPGSLGLLAFLELAARRDEAFTHARNTWRLALPVYLGLLLWFVLTIDGDALHRRSFKQWIPPLGWAGLATWIAAWVTERRVGRRVFGFTGVLLGLMLCAATLQNGWYLNQSLSAERVRAWNVYHYYVGSKYFRELGYTELYAASLTADDDWQQAKAEAKGKKRKRMKRKKDFRKIKQARDMHDYKVKSRADIVAGFDRSSISEERLDELRRDIHFLRKYMGFGNPGWAQAYKDLGYNPAPPWTVMGTLASNAVPTGWPQFWLIVNSDVPLYLLSFLLAWWAFGLRTTAVAVLWLNVIQFNEARFTGGFWQYDWLASAVCSMALYRKGKYALSGVALVWGAMTRVFPGFFLLAIGVKMARDLVLGRPAGTAGGPGVLARFRMRHLRFVGAFTIGCALLFGASHLTGRGLDTWPQWVDKISRHSGTHAVTSNQRVGVGRLAIHNPREGDFWAQERGSKEQRLERSHGRKRMLQLIGLLFFLPALLGRRDVDGMVLTLFFTFILVVLSRYYASTWALLFVLGAPGLARAGPGVDPDEQVGRGDTAAAGLQGWTGVFAGGVLLACAAGFYILPDQTDAYFAINYAIFGMFCLLCTAFVVGDVRRWLAARRAAQAPVDAAPEAPDAAPEAPA
jgi:hypothetical protein